MIIQKSFNWTQPTDPDSRAYSAAALARAYLSDELPASDRRSAELALTVLLDDPSTEVRRRLAQCIASARAAPHHLVLGLAMDQSEIAAPILARSPILSDEELIDCAAIGDFRAQSAIACRAPLTSGVASALAEIGARGAVLTLLANRQADTPVFALRRIFERFGDDPETREALLQNDLSPLDLRLDIARRTAATLAEFVAECAWTSGERARRAARDALERTTVAIAAGAGARDLAGHLRASGELTVALILRSLLSGERALLEAALCDLSGLPYERVAGLVRNWSSAGFSAAYARAGLPKPLLPAFKAALSAQDDLARQEFPNEADRGARLSPRLVERVLTACDDVDDEALGPVMALLHRLACEAARDEAREISHCPRPAPKALPAPLVQIDLAALEAELMAA